MSLTPMYVVTLNWDLKDDTITCVESVLATGVAKEHVIIVDNGSSDGSIEAFADRFGPQLALVCNERNLGFARGMNRGIEYALEQGAASVLLLNNDTVVDQPLVKILLAAGETIGQAGILGPAIYYFDAPQRLWRMGDIRYRWLPMPLTVRNTPDSAPFQVDYVTGCGMLVRRAVFERIGMLDTRYFMYFEDADFCRRAGDAGFSVWCVPQAKMWHKVSLTAQRDKSFNRYHRALSQVRFYREHPHGPTQILRDGYIAAKLLRITLSDIWRGDWNLIGPLWGGTLDGYREQRPR